MKKIGWENRLIEYIQGVASASFRPGVLDCGLFFAGGVKVITGEDYAKPLRGKYRTIEQAYDILNKMGFASHIEYAESIFEPWQSPLLAQRGDGAILKDTNGEFALGIVQGEHVYAMTLSGLTLVPLTLAVKALKV